jgi:hypothetical protein
MLCLGWVDGGAGMTENEAIDELNASIDLAKMCTENLERKREVQGYETAIKALEEIQQYRAIGTVEECRAAMEKQTAKKGIREKIKKGYNRGMHHYYCPVCYEKGDLRNKYNVGSYCSNCGQKLDWSDKE